MNWNTLAVLVLLLGVISVTISARDPARANRSALSDQKFGLRDRR